MSLAPRFICESVKDGKACASESKRKPQGSCRLAVRKLQSLHQECSEFFLFAGFRFQANENANSYQIQYSSSCQELAPSQSRLRRSIQPLAELPYLVSMCHARLCVGTRWRLRPGLVGHPGCIPNRERID